MFQLGLELGGGGGEWRRRLWVWEEEFVEECRELLLTLTLQDSSSDRWLWLPDQTGGYTIRGVYDMLTSQEQPMLHQNMELIWHKQSWGLIFGGAIMHRWVWACRGPQPKVFINDIFNAK
ncbi:hypothetical protein MTR_3g011275 [Medicago truncatula]|uniref:Uncharacterized protein n=1 Tax=Medicago truncatula TaxID=3880 RepID=A0A072UU91_MEDTR|nr:hypothetical protein MTR_3g011275 [Medicago truncatula]